MRPPQTPTLGSAKITERQAMKLSALTGHDIAKLKGIPFDKLAGQLGQLFDPNLLFMRRICGRVVKKDPVTGEEFPVPFATVIVEDTDASFIGYFPKGSKWGWHLPWRTKREVIGKTTTDKCGKFCVWVPRFEIDYILTWRKKRRCYPQIFLRPQIIDILKDIEGIPQPPNPPDPAHIDALNDGMIRRRLKDLIDRNAIHNMVMSDHIGIGASTTPLDRAFNANAFETDSPPPMSEMFQKLHLAEKPELGQEFPEELRKLIASGKLKLDPRRFIGPFFRCFDVLVPELTPILDVPDITFKVTQDVDSDGDQEVIYGESYFDVRWNSGNIPDVTLYAKPIARAAPSCNTPTIACSSGGILFAGLMSVRSTGVDPFMNGDGYAVRPNRPHPSGLLSQGPVTSLPLANTPFQGTLQLYGCTEVPNAKFYRITYQYQEAPGMPLSGQNIMSFPLYVYEKNGSGTYMPVTIYPDINGWIPIGTAAADRFPDRLLMNWPTSGFGVYRLKLEFANAAKTIIPTPGIPVVPFYIDNRAPNLGFVSLEWRVDNSPAPNGAWQPLELICPVVQRPKGSAIEFRVAYQCSGTHFRSVAISGSGCGGAGQPVHDPASGPSGYWHRTVGDSSISKSEIFKVTAASLQGAYGFSLAGVSRAFNPAGGDNGQASFFNYEPVHLYTTRFLPIAIVDI